MERDEIIQKWLRNEISAEEIEFLRKSGDWDSLQRLSRELQNFRAPDYDVDAELQRLISKNHQKESKQIWLQPFFRVAAAVLLLISAYALFIYNPLTQISTDPGQTASIYLPDSSFVLINALSDLSYSQKDWEENRRVKLQGEAFFEVEPGSTFDVETDQGTVRVVGTAFNIRSRQNFFEVLCYEGKVKVITAKGENLLQHGDRVRLLNGNILQDNIKIEAPEGFNYEESHFESVPLYEVINELERQFDVKIVTNDVDLTMLFTVTFSHNNLDIALKAVCVPLNLNYTIDEKQVVIN